jgi:hypothetical protein
LGKTLDRTGVKKQKPAFAGDGYSMGDHLYLYEVVKTLRGT